jgi:acyl carrier protein
MREKTIEQIKNALFKTLKLSSNEEITAKTKLKEDLGLDSMSSLTFLMTLEDNIPGFVVDPDTLDADYLSTVGSITDYVTKVMK